VAAVVAERESADDAAAVVAARARAAAPGAQPVSKAQAEALGPAVGPAADTEQNADPTDYNVARDETIRVATDETLGHLADWLGTDPASIRELNQISAKATLRVGQRLKLPFKDTTHEVFEQRRKAYHRALQASYFAAHRIVGTQVYIARSGDSLWTLTQRGGQLPQWLLQQYNPSLDFSDLRAGTQIVVPRVEDVAPGGG
jgi:membrane-bound lytic murein transglycosylase D